jgi:hypothetical protein
VPVEEPSAASVGARDLSLAVEGTASNGIDLAARHCQLNFEELSFGAMKILNSLS